MRPIAFIKRLGRCIIDIARIAPTLWRNYNYLNFDYSLMLFARHIAKEQLRFHKKWPNRFVGQKQVIKDLKAIASLAKRFEEDDPEKYISDKDNKLLKDYFDAFEFVETEKGVYRLKHKKLNSLAEKRIKKLTTHSFRRNEQYWDYVMDLIKRKGRKYWI